MAKGLVLTRARLARGGACRSNDPRLRLARGPSAAPAPASATVAALRSGEELRGAREARPWLLLLAAELQGGQGAGGGAGGVSG